MIPLQPAVDWLRAGRVVAIPTDTFYGLAVDPDSSAAVQSLFDLKGRDARAAVPLIAASVAQVERYCGALRSRGRWLAEQFWPGPLSLIVDAPGSVAPEVHGGTASIAIRVPAHDVARALCEAFGKPVTATSANRSGEPPARGVQELGGLTIDPRVLILDDGFTPGGMPSTIVDVRGDVPVLVRAGAIPWERVLEFLQE